MKILEVHNRTGKVKLNDDVHKWSADELISDIETTYGNKAVEENLTLGGFVCKADDALEVLEIEVNTAGGSVLDGYRIYNSLNEMRGRGVKVVATVNTLAASMGSVIIMAADEIRIVKGGRIMIHEAHQAVYGDSASHARAAKTLDEMSGEIAEIYAQRTGASVEEMRDLMKKETWMGASESIERGFADTLVEFDKPEKAESTKAMAFLSKLFPGNEQAAQIEAQLEELDSTRAELATALAKVDELTPLAQVNAQLQTELSEVQAKLTEQEKALEEKETSITELTEKATETEAKIQAKASEMLAQLGHPAPANIAPTTPDGSKPKSKHDEYRELQAKNPAAAKAFWDANVEDIKAGK